MTYNPVIPTEVEGSGRALRTNTLAFMHVALTQFPRSLRSNGMTIVKVEAVFETTSSHFPDTSAAFLGGSGRQDRKVSPVKRMACLSPDKIGPAATVLVIF